MIRILFTSIAILASLGLSSINAQQNKETRSLDMFDGISASSSVNVELMKGTTNKAEITVKGIDLDQVVTEVKNGKLKVGRKKNKSMNNWFKGSRIDVVVTYTDDPRYISVSSSADVVGRDIITVDRLELKASSSGDMKLEIATKDLEASVSSSADLIVKGTCIKAEIHASSSGDFVGKGLKVDDAHLSASSSGDIEVEVEKSLEARASSSGDIVYYGNPSVKDVSKSSSGDVSRR